MLDGKTLLLRYGNLRDEDVADDEMTGIVIDEPDKLILNKAIQLQNDGCSIEDIRKQMKALHIVDENINQILDKLNKLTMKPAVLPSRR
jgi:hypothetical protein